MKISKNKIKLGLTVFLTYLFLFVIKNSTIYNSILDPFESSNQSFDIYDVYYKYFQSPTQNEDPDIVLFDIKDLNKSEILKNLETLISGNPKVIALDVVFEQQANSELTKNEIDSFFNKHSEKTVLAFNKNSSSSIIDIQNYPHGHIHLSSEDSYTARKIPVNFTSKNEFVPSFAEVIANKFDTSLTQDLTSNQFIYFNTKGVNNSFQTQSDGIRSFLVINEENTEESNTLWKSRIENKIVLLGSVNNEDCLLNDKFFTPYNENLFGRSLPDMSGVQIHANIVRMLLDKKLITEIPIFIQIPLSIILLLFILIFTHERKSAIDGFDLKLKTFYFIVISILFLIIILCFKSFLWRFSVDIFLIPIILLETSYEISDKIISKFLKPI